jgi:hypothetical protein
MTGTQAALGEVYRRLQRGRRLAQLTLEQARLHRSGRNTDYYDGRVNTFAQAMATVEQVWAEIVEHNGGSPSDHPLEPITQDNHR